MKTILVTGGTGYIGSHTVIELLESGFEPIIVDNLSNSSKEVLDRIQAITGHDVPFYEHNLNRKKSLESIFDDHQIDAVIHFAGLKAVGESVAEPLHYYRNNLVSTLNLCEVMIDRGVNRLIFSSSATVYGDPSEVPISENESIKPTNPYGQTKAMIEQILTDTAKANPSFKVTLLRYFNPIGAHESGLIGEDPSGKPNNLLPFVAQVAVGRRDKVAVFGNDYDTPDGTGVRDYIHVVDLAKGHLAALKTGHGNNVKTYNLGTGHGYSVLQVIKAFESASGKSIPYEIVARRPGDIASCYANPSLAQNELNWKATHTLEQACEDSWRWQSQNPHGFNKN